MSVESSTNNVLELVNVSNDFEFRWEHKKPTRLVWPTCSGLTQNMYCNTARRWPWDHSRKYIRLPRTGVASTNVHVYSCRHLCVFVSGPAYPVCPSGTPLRKLTQQQSQCRIMEKQYLCSKCRNIVSKRRAKNSCYRVHPCAFCEAELT